MKRLMLLLLVLLNITLAFSRNDSLETKALRIDKPPKIDGFLDEDVWKHASVLTNFTQSDPFQGRFPSFQTKVFVLYDDEAIYIGAYMYDSSPDSILRQLGDRDHELNADDIVFQFDPFNNNQDAYYFRVTASNVQSDWRKRDGSYSSVWHSRTAIHDDGWSVEIKIPFSSIRIPAVQKHSWAFQVTRNIRRYREFSKWAPETKGVDNEMIFWGTLREIENIQPPVRLSLTPYLSIFAETNHNSLQDENFSVTPIGGLDLKYGINESFTLDLTLLPDFSQVRSDDVIKNLSAFEVNFSEQRPFFLETMDLFRLGGLFYSRRIGRFPSGYYKVQSTIEENEEIISNPASVSLINSFKITGQTNKGLSVGVLNAITDRTTATIRDAEGNAREVVTEHLSNYNVFVLRQALPYNSWVYLVNTNLLREGANITANVTGTGVKLYTPENKYALTFNGSSSSRILELNDVAMNKAGFAWNIMAAKVRGKFQYHYYHQMKNDKYDINDMGMNFTNDETHDEIQMSYRFFDPFWKLLRLNLGAGIWRSGRISTGMPTSKGLNASASTTTVRHLSLWTRASCGFSEVYDYYEPRTPGFFYVLPGSYTTSLGFSSDYRRPFALDGSVGTTQRKEINNEAYSASLSPIIRLNDHFQFAMGASYNINMKARGFAGRNDEGIPVFGKRNVTTVENSFSGKYMFRNNLSLSMRIRHYWSKGQYEQFYLLSDEGRLISGDNIPVFNDFNFNSFLIDLVFNWEFAPGSNLTIVWKNSIVDEHYFIVESYWENLGDVFEKPQTNLLSLKFIYYLDYHTVISKLKK